MKKKSKTVSQAEREAVEERQASERGRRLGYTIKQVARRLIHPTEEDRGKVERKRRRG